MATATNMVPRQTSKEPLPEEVASCLKHARFLHLATCSGNIPHVALMNYTYIPPTSLFEPEDSGPGKIVMLFSSTTRKASNVASNPHVSLLVHDWSSHRPLQSISNQENTGGFVTGSPPNSSGGGSGGASGLATLLQNLNSSSLSTHSHTIRGHARMLEDGSEEERYYREKHVEGNQGEDVRCFIEGDEGSKVVLVDVEGGKVADWKGSVSDWGLPEEQDS